MLSQLFINMILTEITGNLFDANENICLAHCVSADFVMGVGIALQFRQKYGRVDELRQMNVKVGQCAVLDCTSRQIFYLITKEKYYLKPTCDTLKACLLHMKNIILTNNIKQIAMPQIGCGLDRLNWTQVKAIIIQVFGTTDLTICVYKL